MSSLETGGVFSCENTPKGHTYLHKVRFLPINEYVEKMVLKNDLE